MDLLEDTKEDLVDDAILADEVSNSQEKATVTISEDKDIFEKTNHDKKEKEYVDLTKPVEGKPVSDTRGVNPDSEQSNHEKKTIRKKLVRFSDEPLEIDQNISHYKKKKPKKLKSRIDPFKLRRSTRDPNNSSKFRRSSRNSKQNLVTTSRSHFASLLGGAMAVLGAFLISNVPLQLDSAWNRQDAKSRLEDTVETWDDWSIIGEDPKSRKLEYYHYIVDSLQDIEDAEDAYQDYVWKVDKIVSHKRRGKQTFLHVIWKPGNKSWISLKSLRFHDPYACVMYAVAKKLVDQDEWNWTKDFIDDTKEYTRLLYALKTSKSMGPKYKFGVEVP